jgi:small subunit ribosomal protein S20
MAITKSAKRAIKVSERKAFTNAKRERTMKDAVKTLRKSVLASAKTTTTDLQAAYKALDKAAKGGIIKKGTADRKKSRLAKAVAKVSK